MAGYYPSNPGYIHRNDFETPPRNSGGARGVGIVQILLGFVLITLEVVGLGLGLQEMDIITMIGGGIWSGALFIITGFLGVTAGNSTVAGGNRKCLYTGFLITSIFSCLTAVGMVLGCIASVFAMPFLGLLCGNGAYQSSFSSACYHADALLPLRLTAAFIYGLLFVLFIVTAGFGCCNVCGSDSHLVIGHQIVQHGAYPGQQQVQFYPAGQHGHQTPGQVRAQPGFSPFPPGQMTDTVHFEPLPTYAASVKSN